MNTQLSISWWRKIEPGIVVLLLLVTWDFLPPPFMPSFISSAIKPGSYLAVALFVMGSRKQVMYAATRDISLLILILLAPASYLWSAAPYYTLDDSKALFRTFLFGAYLAGHYTPKQQMQLLAWLFGMAGLLSAAAALAIPSYGISFVNDVNTWNGIFSHKQYLARSMAMGAVIFLLNALDKQTHRWAWFIGFLFALVLILLTTSKSGLVLIILSLCLLPFSQIVKQNYKLQVFFYLLGLVIAGSITVFVADNLEDIVVHKLGKDLSFNGRTDIWTLCMDKIWERPFLGYGYAGFWTSEASDYVFDNSWAGEGGGRDPNSRFHAHSGFIDLLLGFGFVGAFLFAINFITVLTRTIALLTLNKTKESLWMLQFLTIMFLYNFSEVGTIVSNHAIWCVYVAVALSTALEQERNKRKYALNVAVDGT